MLNRTLLFAATLAMAACDDGMCVEGGVGAIFRVVDAASNAPVCPYSVRILDADGRTRWSYAAEEVDGRCASFFSLEETPEEAGTYVFEISASGYEVQKVEIELAPLPNCSSPSLAAPKGEEPTDGEIVFKLAM